MKLSVRSEVQEIHAGNLFHLALKGLGDGGGHQVMAGGLVKKMCWQKCLIRKQ